jgi:hypothetical protein
MDDETKPKATAIIIKLIQQDEEYIYECSSNGLAVRHKQKWQAFVLLRQLYVSKGLDWPC